MAMIDDFKANLVGGGARANQFRVTITPPAGIAIGLDVRRTSFMVRSSNLPAQEMTPIEVPFRGRKIYIAGDREFADPWTTTFINDTDFDQWMVNWLSCRTAVRSKNEMKRSLVYGISSSGKSSTILGRPSPSLSFNPRY